MLKQIEYHLSKLLLYRYVGGVIFFGIAALLVYIQHSVNILHLILLPLFASSIYSALKEYKNLGSISFSEESVTLRYFNNEVVKKNLSELREIKTVKNSHLFSSGKTELKFTDKSYFFRDDLLFEQFITNNKNYFDKLDIIIKLR